MWRTNEIKMKKEPLIYNEQIVGYIDSIDYQGDVINEIKIFLFSSNYYEEIINKIKKSTISNINNIKFEFKLEEDILTLKNTEL